MDTTIFGNIWCQLNCNFYKISTVFVVIFVIYKLCRRKTNLNLPPGPRCLPIVGYLPFISGQIPYLTFNELAKKYGPIFGLQIGFRYCVILNEYDLVKEAFKKDCLNGRAPGTFELPSKFPNIGAINGKDWIDHRKLFGNYTRTITKTEASGTSLLEDIIVREADNLVDKIKCKLYYKEEDPVNVREIMDETLYKIVIEYLMGKDRLRVQDAHVLKVLLGQHTPMLKTGTVTAITQSFYRLRFIIKWFDPMYGDYKRYTEHLENILRMVVEFHRREVREGDTKDYVDYFLNQQKSNPNVANYADPTLIGNLEALLAGGTHTIKTSLEWLFAILSEKQDIQDKIYHEIKLVLTEEGKVTWNNRSKLLYTQAVILESLRLFTISPVNTPRFTTEDTTIMSYDIPRGTVVYSNNWKINHDDSYWKEPFKFLPERFIDQNRNIINSKSSERLSSFSYGKRECPGKLHSMMELLIILTSILKDLKILPSSNNVPILSEHQSTMFSMPQNTHIRFQIR